MVYTVKKLSGLSGVTVRTLHFYEEAGILKPAYYGSNGYRYYGENELLRLQQILFFKELGFSIKQIQKVLGRSDFDQISALNSHRRTLCREWERLRQLIDTIDKTIDHLNGKTKMKEEDMYDGFITKEKQEEYKEYLKNRFGSDHPEFAECERNVSQWTQADWQRYKSESESNMRQLAGMMERRLSPDCSEVQAVIQSHYKWLKKFWTPDRQSYVALGQMYTELEWKKFFGKFDPNHPRLALFLADAMRVFAERELL